jgi:hypothetical protein
VHASCCTRNLHSEWFVDHSEITPVFPFRGYFSIDGDTPTTLKDRQNASLRAHFSRDSLFSAASKSAIGTSPSQ